MKKELKYNYNSIFFIGIGGISMSALADLCKELNINVGGSDATSSLITEKLKKQGIKIYFGHSEKNISKFKPDLVVYTGAIKSDNPELVFAQNNNIRIMERADFLGEICKNYTNVISIGGTHGKTTTTAMIGEIFLKAGLNPTIHVGGEVKNLNGNLVKGGNEYFITEACEYKKSFEKIFSTCAVITNIERDHMDCYKDLDDLYNSFKTFAEQSDTYVICGNTDLVNLINKKLEICLCGMEENFNYYAKNLNSKNGKYEFDCYEEGKFLMRFKMNVVGAYNVTNALFAISVARKFNVPLLNIFVGLKEFNGVKRRNEFMGEINNIPVYADYCHHPTEIENSIAGFKEIYKNILCVFQPHTYSRTIALKQEFKNCFKGVKNLVVFKTYAAREPYDENGSETALFENINFKNKTLILSLDDLDNYLKEVSKPIDVIIVLGAGDLYNHFVNL